MQDEGGPGGAIIRQVIGLDSPYLSAAVDLFKEIFPDEQHYVPYLRACTLLRSPDHPATLDHVWVVERDGHLVGVRIFSYVLDRDVGHGAYVGMLAPHRGQGLGSWLVRRTLAQLCADAEALGRPKPLGYCVEVDPVGGAADEAERRERKRVLHFHLTRGGLLLDVDYVEPPMIQGVGYITAEELAGVEPRPMHLIFYPTPPRAALDQAELIQVVEALYLDVYRLTPDSWYMCRAMDSIRRWGKA